MFNFNNIPAELRASPTWGVFECPDKDTGKSKQPVASTKLKGLYCCNNIDSLETFEAAVSKCDNMNRMNSEVHHLKGCYCVAVALPHNFVVIDYDGEHAFDYANDVNQVAPTWCEQSVSGAGVHAVFKRDALVGLSSQGALKKVKQIDILSTGHFLVMTGNVLLDAPIASHATLPEQFHNLGCYHSPTDYGHDLMDSLDLTEADQKALAKLQKQDQRAYQLWGDDKSLAHTDLSKARTEMVLGLYAACEDGDQCIRLMMNSPAIGMGGTSASKSRKRRLNSVDPDNYDNLQDFYWKILFDHTSHGVSGGIDEQNSMKRQRLNEISQIDLSGFQAKLDNAPTKHQVAQMFQQQQVQSERYQVLDVFSQGQLTVNLDTLAENGDGLIITGERAVQGLQTSQWLLSGVLLERDVGFVYGESTAGKTYVCLDMAYHIHNGASWGGRKTKKTNVLYVATEALGSVKKRLLALKKKAFPSLPYMYNRDDFRLTIPQGTSETEKQAYEQRGIDFVQACKKWNIGLIIIDTFSAACAGVADENSNREMAEIIGTLRNLSVATSACVLAVHHTGKGEAKTYRGASVLKANSDVFVKVDKMDGITIEKTKDGVYGNIAKYVFDKIDFGRDNFGDMETVSYISVVANHLALPELPEQAKVTWTDTVATAARELQDESDAERDGFFTRKDLFERASYISEKNGTGKKPNGFISSIVSRMLKAKTIYAVEERIASKKFEKLTLNKV